ncbi:MAG: Gfo/Idh/MocA family oxidoreductase [Treponema sp.]|jgi:predicted dehydrogenase|nr:Gfo/Idh/MocA family oxidoreductase [Treponema sp.]
MTKKEPRLINAAIVGLGRIASLLEEDGLREKPCTHAGAITANPECVLVSGCDTDVERRRLFSEKWRVPVYEDASEMLHIHKPGILVIATHPDSHFHYCALAAKHKVPVIICEKPLADSAREARKIARLADGEKGGPVIIINHERRYSLDYIRAKEILDGEKLGALVSARAVLYMGKNRRLIDVFWHDGTHLADAVMFLTGLVLKHRKSWGVKLSSRNGTAWLEGTLVRGENTQSGIIQPIPVIMEIGAGRDHLVFEIEFSCGNGRLRIGNGVFEVWESAPSPYAEKFCSLRKTNEAFTGPTGYFANMLQDAAACFREPGRLPRSSAKDGLRVIEYLNRVRPWR